MKIADPFKVSTYKFYMLNPEGIEIEVPSAGYMASIQQITSAVLSYIGVYDGSSNGEYSSKQRALAQQAGVSFEVYVRELIEHQMCLRQTSIKCWKGTGDKVHSAFSSVDRWVERTPAPIRNLVQNTIAKITPSHSRTFGGCSACGGSRIMSPSKNNLGRAGTINKIVEGGQ